MGHGARHATSALRAFERELAKGILKKNAAYLARLDTKKWRVVVQDESIFVFDVKIRKIWVLKGTKPIILTTGSHRRIVVYGALADDGSQFYRLMKNGDGENFLEYLKELHARFAFMVLFLDRATYHAKGEKVLAYLHLHRDSIRVRWFPPGFPESNPVEETWRQGKESELGSFFPESFDEFKTAIRRYYRTRRFKLNLYNYLCH